MFTREKLIAAFENYHSPFVEEEKLKARFLELLQHPRCFFKDHLPGNITGSSWVVDKRKQYTLLTHHAKLNRWLQPGGHADGEEDVLNVALREATEETGVQQFRILSNDIFDIDIHPIPARKDFPQHDHYDIRFLFEASIEDPLIITEESHDLAWKNVDELPSLTNHNPSILRMAEKVKALF